MESFVTTFGKQVTGRQSDGMARVAGRLRLVADQRTACCAVSDIGKVFSLVAEQGRGLARSGDEVTVLSSCGWLRMNRAVLTVRRVGSGGDTRSVEVLIRAAALEGRISQRGARRLLDKIAGLVAPYLITPLQPAP